MGDPRRKNDDGFEQEALSVLQGGNDTGFDDEAAGVLAPKRPAPETKAAVFSEPDPGGNDAQETDNIRAANPGRAQLGDDLADEYAANPANREMEDYLHQVATDPKFALEQLVKLGSNYATGAIGALGSESGVVGNALWQGGAAAANRFTHDKLDDVGTLEALLNAGKDGLYAGGAALGLGKLGDWAGAGSAKARAAAFNADKADLAEAGITADELAQRSDELGLNNQVIPMDAADKRARIQQVLADRGAQQRAAIATADEGQPFSGRNLNEEIARDIDANADRTWRGRSNQREATVAAMGKTANAVEQGDPIDSLRELANYRTQQGGQAFGKFGTLPEAASGRGALAGYDAADQRLQEGMAASGDANYRLFTSADADYHDLKLLDELAQSAPPSNPWRRAIGAGVGAAAGGIVGGGYPGMAAGAAVADMTRGYQADAMANLGAGLQRNLGAASTLTGAATSATEQLQQVQSQSRGQMQPQIVESLLDSNPQALGPYAQPLMQARKDGTLNQKLTQLRNTDDVWQRQYMPQLQQMSAQAQ